MTHFKSSFCGLCHRHLSCEKIFSLYEQFSLVNKTNLPTPFFTRAQNKLGTIEAEASLTVKAKPRPIELVVMPHDMSAPKGTTIQMACRAEGSPTPTIKWLKDGHEMSSPRFNVRPDGSLVVQNVSEEDEGMYSCIAENSVERRSAEARLTLRQTRDT